MVARVISKVKEALAVIITVTTLLSGAITVTWCKIALPEVDKRIVEKQSPVVAELKKLNSSVRFQTYIQMGSRPQCEYDSLLKDWNRLNSGGTE
jgi:Flp pilus assembly protein protease CpaA